MDKRLTGIIVSAALLISAGAGWFKENRSVRAEEFLMDDIVHESASSQEKDASDETEIETFMEQSDSVIEEPDLKWKETEYFTIDEIPEDGEIFKRIEGKSYQENDDIDLEDLRYLSILYYDFDHEVQEGELIVNEAIAEDCLEIFKQLYEEEYEIASVKLIDEYWTGDGDTTDTASIEANNTSAFCYRMTTSGKSLSKHALGCAIDINPGQNPYFDYSDGEPIWYHEGDENYLDRDTEEEHMITEEDLCYQLFTEYGFTWGGNWNNPKDYQHFERK